MRRHIACWTRGHLTCATRSAGLQVKPTPTPILVGESFNWAGGDVLQLPLLCQGNRYTMKFMDYLTKRPEVVAAPDRLH